MPQGLNNTAELLGRVALAVIFLLSGFNKIMHFSSVQGMMQKGGITFMTPLFLFGAIVFLLAGGASLVLGYKTRIGALLLIVFLIPTTYYFHNFWGASAAEAQSQQIHFMKNLAILGGLLCVLSNGAGQFSLDKRGGGGGMPAPKR